MNIFRNIISGISDICLVWKNEMKNVVKDEGVLIFFPARSSCISFALFMDIQ